MGRCILKKEWIAIIATLVILALACNAPGQSTQPAANATSGAGEVVPGGTAQANDQANQAAQESPTEEPPPTETPASTPTPIPFEPVGIRLGLASLDSYIITLGIKTTGPGAKDLMDMQNEIQYSKDANTSLTHTHSANSSEDNPDKSTNDSYVYRIGNEECSGSGDDWTYSSMTPAQKELVDIYQQMVDITPIIGEPELIGPENVNGIDTNHFSFKIKGLGASSGAEVTANQGDYWMAIDGRYIVRYSLVLETRGGENSEIMREEFHIELTNVNQPVPAAVFPAGCIAAKNKPKQ
jgi:hypothetical protein